MALQIELKSLILKTDDTNVSNEILQKLHFPKGRYLTKRKREYLQIIADLQEIKDNIQLFENTDLQSK